MSSVPFLARLQSSGGPRVTNNPPTRTPLPSFQEESLADAIGHISAALTLLLPHHARWVADLSGALDRRRLEPVPASLVLLTQGLAALAAAHTNLSDGLADLKATSRKGT
jgi:hypothetical protein